MREMVFRERSERVAHVRALAAIASRLVGMDTTKFLGDVVAEYAAEVFQEAYDPIALERKARRLREAQGRIRKKQAQDAAMVNRLNRMEILGQDFDKKKRRFTNDSKPVKRRLKSSRG